MSIGRGVVVLVVVAGCHRSISDENSPAAPAPRPEPVLAPRVLEHRVTCGRVTAIWRGNADDGFDVYDSLAFEIGGRTRKFRGELVGHGESFTFDIFSPDCRRVMLLQSRLGPYHVVRTDQLAAYLDGAPPEYVLAGERDPAGITGTGVFRDGGFINDNEVGYTWGCCDPPITTTVKLRPL